jgi:uncharacterized membrane protein (TIGR02234 family)
MTDAPSSTRTARSYRAALALLAVGAVLLLVGFGRTWVTAVVRDAGLPTVTVELTGRDLAPAGAAMAVVALAGLAALVATRRVGRMLTGLVLALAGLIAVGSALRYGAWSGSTMALVADRAGVAASDATTSTTTTLWWVVAAVGGALVLTAGALSLVASSTWTTLGGRYERRSSTQPAPKAAAASAWDQLDAGLDPTLDTPPATPSERTAGADGPAGADLPE